MAAFTDPEVEQSLALTEEQKARIRTIFQEQEVAVLDRPVVRGQRSVEGLHEILKQGVPRILALLTEEQRDAWTDLAGAPFTMKGIRAVPEGGFLRTGAFQLRTGTDVPAAPVRAGALRNQQRSP
jgi:hypothetical protein